MTWSNVARSVFSWAAMVFLRGVVFTLCLVKIIDKLVHAYAEVEEIEGVESGRGRFEDRRNASTGKAPGRETKLAVMRW